MVAGEQETIYKRRVDEISARALVIRVRSYILMILGFWYLLILAALPLAYKNYTATKKILPTYPAKIAVLVQTHEPSKEQKVMTQVFAVLAGSRKAIHKTLMKNTFLRGKPDFLINHYLQTYQRYYPDQIPGEIPEDFRFESTDPSKYEGIDRIAYAFVINRVSSWTPGITDGVVSVSHNDKLGFIFLKIATPMEELSILFLDKLYETFEEIYLENIVHSEKKSLIQMRERRDSMKRDFDKNFSYLLKKRDQYDKLFKSRDSTVNLNRMARKIQEKEINVEFLKLQYLDYAKKVKEAEVELTAKSPLIMITEKTLSPISPIQPSAVVAAIKGALIGIFVMIALLMVRRIYLDILKESV